jgi:predicted peptidase
VPCVLPDSTDIFTDVAERIKGLSTWIFHGDADEAIPVDESRMMAKALEQAGGDVRYTEFHSVGHNAWDTAYGMSEFTDWLLLQKRNSAPAGTIVDIMVGLKM